MYLNDILDNIQWAEDFAGVMTYEYLRLLRRLRPPRKDRRKNVMASEARQSVRIMAQCPEIASSLRSLQ
jgi:hypothetical protein